MAWLFKQIIIFLIMLNFKRWNVIYIYVDNGPDPLDIVDQYLQSYVHIERVLTNTFSVVALCQSYSLVFWDPKYMVELGLYLPLFIYFRRLFLNWSILDAVTTTDGKRFQNLTVLGNMRIYTRHCSFGSGWSSSDGMILLLFGVCVDIVVYREPFFDSLFYKTYTAG